MSRLELETARGVAEKWKQLFEERNAEWQKAEAKLQAIEELLKLDGCDAEADDDCDCVMCDIWRALGK